MTASTGLFKSSVISDATGNGGIITNNAVIDNAAANLFPHVPESERTAGQTRYRKAHIKKLSGTLTEAKFMADRLSTAGDYMQITRGGYDDTQETADDIGWEDTNITWTSGTRKVTMAATHPELAVGTLVLFTTSAGAFRGLATVASYIDTQNFTISTMIRGSDPANTDHARTFWIGSGDLHTALTGGVSTTIVADYEAASGVYVGMYVALVDWDVLDGDGLPLIEYCLVTAVSWASEEATITVSSAIVSNHAVKTQGIVEGTEGETFDLDGLTLIIKVNGGDSQTITFAADGQTAAEVVATINATLVGATAAVYDTDKVSIETDDYYAENSIQVVSDSTADTELGLDNSVHYGTTGTVVAGVLELGTVAADHSTPVKSSALGTFTDNITDYDLGATYDTFTVTFSSATEFTVAGASSGTIGSGVITSAFAVAHWGSYYFAIPTSCWGGTWASADTVTFTTYPSARGIWFKEVVPALTDAYSGNQATFTLDGES
ncbi:MAG: hypothetical protein JW765_09805 [Deltaproteobacteria bacterium]|nr:hypothetical protein [Candidatus Zymogenaceae bacterium]